MNKKYLLAYTVSFAAILLAWCSPFIFGEKLPLTTGDARIQHYPALVYTGTYIKEFARSIWAGAPVLPLYDFSIGMGDDIMTPLMAHSANADIGNLVFAFFPASHSLSAYALLIILRLYVAGLAFSYFGFVVLKADKQFILIGTLIYTFCNWTFIYAFTHLSFLLALIYLPLIVTGYDAILNNKKPYLFIVSVFLLAVASFYFLYMQTILLIFYAFIRMHMLYKESYFKNLIVYGIKSFGFYAISIMMAAVTFIPLLYAHLTSGRESHINADSLWHFSFQEYLNLFTAYHSIEAFGNVLIQPTGMSAIASVAIVLLFANKQIKHRKHLISTVVIVLLFLLIPFGSFLLNGFGYVTNRCGFLFSFAFATVTILVLPYVINVGFKRNATMLAIYAGILFTAILINPDKTYNMLVGFGFALVFIIVLLLPVGSKTIRFFKTEKVKVNGIICVIIINLIFNAYFNEGFSFVSNDMDGYLNRVLKVSDYIKDDSFYREHNSSLTNFIYTPNLSMLGGYYGISAYWSMVNPAYQDFSVKLENAQQRHMEWWIVGFDDRSTLNALSSVKYYISDDENVPFGYIKFAELANTVQSWGYYFNEYALPLGYTYTKMVSADEYNKLDALDKQTVLMQAAVLPDEYIKPCDTDLHSILNKVKIPYTVTKQQHTAWVDGVLNILETEETYTTDDYVSIAPAITLTFEGLPNSETYIRIAGINTANKNYSGFIDISNSNINKLIYITPLNLNHIIRRDGHIANLGYSENAKNYTEITFYLMENYSIRDIEVYCLPMDDYPAWVNALREDVLENIVIGINRVSGNITLEEEKVLVLSIPYSKGWSCKVNGEVRTLLKANHMFMGLPLGTGYHSIELTYRTPGLLAGVITSLIGMVVFGMICVFYSRRKRLACCLL